MGLRMEVRIEISKCGGEDVSDYQGEDRAED